VEGQKLQIVRGANGLESLNSRYQEMREPEQNLGEKHAKLQRSVPGTPARILIVDHFPQITDLIREPLVEAGRRVESTEDLARAADAIAEYAPHCIVLNFHPREGKRPFYLIDEIRSWFKGPIVVVSEGCSENTKVMAFERGADDYVCAPLPVREFSARVDALLRRSAQPLPPRYLKVGSLHIDVAARSAFLDGEGLQLTSKEFDILVCLAQKPGVVVSAEALLTAVWGPGFIHYNQTLRVHVSNLRKKCRTVSSFPDFIRSVPGNGYIIDSPMVAR